MKSNLNWIEDKICRKCSNKCGQYWTGHRCSTCYFNEFIRIRRK